MRAKDKSGNEEDLLEKRRRRLATGVLKQAARDLRRLGGATSRAGQELYEDAYRWLTVNEFSWPFSFLNVCQTLRLVPETVRAELIREELLGTFAYLGRQIASAIVT